MIGLKRRWAQACIGTEKCGKAIHQIRIQLLIGLLSSLLLFSATLVFYFTAKNGLGQFFLSILTVIPLSILIRIAREDLVVRFQLDNHEVAAGLTNAIFGNSIEICFAIVAVAQNEALVAQTSLTGAVLSNCLLILGTCFLCGGFQNGVRTYPVVMARDKAQLLVLSLASIVLPTVFKLSAQAKTESGLPEVSRSSAIVLFLVFSFYVVYEYRRHAISTPPSVMLGLASAGAVSSAPVLDAFKDVNLQELRSQSLEHSGKEAKLPIVVNLCILFVSLALTAFVSLLVVQSIEAPHTAIGMSKSFVGLVVIPSIYGCAEQTVTAARSRAENIDWIIEIAIDSSIRVTLFVLPLAVLVGWVAGDDSMSLFFDAFQVTILGLVVLLVNYIMHTGSSHWYGKMLLLRFS
ncbi:uncharacterized protein TRUGW13939_09742 [Talaromyces rugulosus]|uniref:Sodium/calcium exchanger membrane region domain-containing protein n=1 Tax=Talaromyces rugulosus TaxID=121627 RepID=A0A7H8RA11_TALRU|nr:uncharacterized protein TRUGW13939_09742 [Talaromyces rugulosus]QKX62581.1 hypothetical protein TRUGW13939_09742 [Talaromyces rugulosus]